MILITGGAGFIGSNLINELLRINIKVVICDYKKKIRKSYFEKIDNIFEIIEPKDLINFINNNNVKVIIHLGAISSTTYHDCNKIWLNNIFLSNIIWKICSIKNIRLIYASSAATYGNGKNGFLDKEDLEYLDTLKPLNVYAWSKNEVDKRNVYAKNILNLKPPQWVALKFFNVYGPNELHKKNMISIVLKTFQQIKKNESTSLFKSHNTKFYNGEQKRDFIYVKDCVKVLLWFLDNNNISGIFNVGTGEARTFNDLVSNVYKNMKKNINIKYIDMPGEIKDQYQYMTKAEIIKLMEAGYNKSFYTLEEGVKDYVNNYLNVEGNAIS